MDSVKHCRDQAAECLRLMKAAKTEMEARMLRDLAQSWTRIANQMERYSDFINRRAKKLTGTRSSGAL